jgi:DNA mismatch repair ATPase MutS
MKVFLMFPDRDLELQPPLPANQTALIQDLELNTLFEVMAGGDAFLFEAAQKTVLSGFRNDQETIRYRQDILKDCLENRQVIRRMYSLAVEALEKERKNFWGLFNKSPVSVLHRSLSVLQMFVTILKQLKTIADEQGGDFKSEGFSVFFAMLQRELDAAYFLKVQDHLKALEFNDGVLISAELGMGNEGSRYVLRKPHEKKQGWLERLMTKKSPAYTFSIDPRDQAGGQGLSELQEKGINLVANALGQSADHILSFFILLRAELAFYVGCLNLQEQLTGMGAPISFPRPANGRERRHTFRGLYDICLALTVKQKIVGNALQADQKDLILITGANQGGKSTFLRSIGLSQLMMQCGLFVPAEDFMANLCDGLFTHYKREEDAAMKSGKLDEELNRMSTIVDQLSSNSMLLFNESFAATNEREGSEIARQITSALLEKGFKIFFVTHLYPFAHSFMKPRRESAHFLRAERQDDGQRTFRLIEGDPLETSYGEDLYRTVWAGAAPQEGNGAERNG